MRKLATGIALFILFWLLFAWLIDPVSATLFSVVLIVHEAGHMIVMLRNGIPVDGIYFIPFLGAMVVSCPPKERWTAIKVFLAGPALGALGGLVAVLWFAVSPSETAARFAYLSAFVNLLNLLPVLPLDGGGALSTMASSEGVPYEGAYRVLYLAFASTAVMLSVFGLWMYALILVALFRRPLAEVLKRKALGIERARVRRRLEELFPGPYAEAAAAAPIDSFRLDRVPAVPEALLADPEFAVAYARTVREAASRDRPAPAEDAPIEEVIAYLEGGLEADVELRERSFTRSAVEHTYRRAVMKHLYQGAEMYRLVPFIGPCHVIAPSDLDPFPAAGTSPLEKFLATSDLPGLTPTESRKAGLAYCGLLLGVMALTFAAGSFAHWSFLPAH